jgi:hypothetical protein
MATPWVTIDADLVLTKLSSPELVAFRSKALASGQADPLAEVISQVVDSVRQGIGQNANNVLAAGQTVPPSAVRHTLAIIRPLIASRLPGMARLMDEIRKTEWENAETWVKSKPLVESPVDPAEAQLSSPRPRITSKVRKFADQDGL